MAGSIFLLQGGANLVKLQEEPYDSEGLLQQLLAQYPDLLAGDQIDSNEPRRWLLISREMGVPGEEDGAGRWSLDHLFLDQSAVPTLVEVKRSSDTRIRREVVGQMLDYAANAVVYWPVETIRAEFEKTCEAQGTDPEEQLTNLIGETADPEEFWKLVKTNLQAGRIRMVFVADEIPPELRRIVEFLNGQMDPAEVLAVEIKQFVGQQMQTLVPRVIGLTESARTRKETRPGRRVTIDEQRFLAAFNANRSEEEQAVGQKIMEWAGRLKLQASYKEGQKQKGGAVFMPLVRQGNDWLYPLSLQSSGYVSLPMRWLRDYAPFSDPAKRQELWSKIKGIPGLRTSSTGMEGFPKVPLSSLTSKDVLDGFLATMTWAVDQIQQAGRV